MIIAIVYTLMYLFFGVISVRFLLPRHRPLNRLWLGISFGLLLEMWLPAICAYFFRFTGPAHGAAAVLLSLVTLLCVVFGDKRPPARWDEKENVLLKQLMMVALPLTMLSACLQYTHVMRVDMYGNWHVGQSTYGDLPMHLSFITNLVGKKFPPDYSFYPGSRLSYPFLADSLSSTFYLYGTGLQAAVIIPAVLMMALCFTGVMVLARELTAGKKTVILAALLFFLNGGLGFIYNFDLVGESAPSALGGALENIFGKGNVPAAISGLNGNSYKIDADYHLTVQSMLEKFLGAGNVPDYAAGADGRLYQINKLVLGRSVGGTGVSGRIKYILEEYYQAPTNRPGDLNLQWSNVICDLMIPQRTLLGGWCMVIPCFYLFSAAFRPRKVCEDRGGRALVLLAVWAGALPLVHTHSFLALALMSFGAMVYDLIHGDPKDLETRRPRSRILARYAVYGIIAAARALPHVISFTFDQVHNSDTVGGFIRFQFNWVNNPSGKGMRDMYLWFYIKNIGLPFIVLILALFEKNPRHRRIFAMMLPVVLAAEFIVFQPNVYDNNKLFYLAWLMGCMIVADWFAMVWGKLKGLRGRGALAVLTSVVLFLSAGLTIWRECVSDYTAFTAGQVAVGDFARDETPRDAVYLAAPENHLNPVMSIAGKTMVCGPDLWLYWHGFDTSERKSDIRAFYADPERRSDILRKYNVTYIYVSSYERNNYVLDEQALRRNYDVVFDNGAATIYHVPEG